MPLEIEVKFPVDSFAVIEAALTRQGAVFGAPASQSDLYFAHPQRDFAQTDEAFRLRRLASSCRLTYKGPRLDRQSKTRREIEISLAAEEVDAIEQLFLELGFRPVATVEKRRRVATLDRKGMPPITIALDDVADIGRFIEFEVVSETDEFQAIRDELLRVAEAVGLRNSETRSYLELLLERPG